MWSTKFMWRKMQHEENVGYVSAYLTLPNEKSISRKAKTIKRAENVGEKK